MINLDQKIYGYRRDNNRVGIRNYVVILPVDDISNAACEAVSNNIKGTIALPHPYGRLQFGEDLRPSFQNHDWYWCKPKCCCRCGYWN